MNRQKTITTIKILLWIIGIILFSIGSYFAYEYILEPSYVSLQGACFITYEEIEQKYGYSIAGSFNPKDNSINIVIPSKYSQPKYIFIESYLREPLYFYDNSWQGINAYKKTKQYKRVLKHELCHKRQLKQRRLGHCYTPRGRFKLFLSEVECNVVEWF